MDRTQTRENNKANEITGLSEPESQTQWVVPEYDARGNMITVPKPDSPGLGLHMHLGCVESVDPGQGWGNRGSDLSL